MTKDRSDPNVTLVLGFTGTRRDVGQDQIKMLKIYLKTIWMQKHLVIAHHGDCIGADTIFHNECVSRDFGVVIHPPLNADKRAFNLTSGQALTIMPLKTYLARNHDIVDACHELIACPGEMNEVQRSGTWATIRYAREIRREIFIIFPDGSTKHEKGAR